MRISFIASTQGTVGEPRRGHKDEKRRRSGAMRVVAGAELIERLGAPDAFAAAYDENRRALGPNYIDYVFTVSGAEHAISLALGAFVLTVCDTLRPAAAVDLGSGFSSYVLRRYAEGQPSRPRIVSVDDDRGWLAKTAEFLRAAGLPEDELVHWSEFEHDESPFDLVLYDLGTWERRLEALPTALHTAQEGALVILDDLHVAGYRSAVERALDDAGLTPYDVSRFTSDEFGRFSWAVLT
jgi:predicted O-methyltransferase YrrM